MPIPGAHYAVTTTDKGKKVRLAFVGKGKGHVVEAKNLKTGATHTPAEFGEDVEKRKDNEKAEAQRRAMKGRHG